MPPVVKTGVVQLVDSMQYVTGSGGNILSAQALPHVGAIAFSGAFNWNDNQIPLAMMGYLFEIWQASICKEMGNDVTDPTPFADVKIVNVSADDLRSLFLTFDAPPIARSRFGKTNVCYDIGTLQFLYGTQLGPIQRLRFLKQKHVPEYTGCTGAVLTFHENMSGNYFFYNRTSTCPRIKAGSGNEISPWDDTLAGAYFGADLYQDLMVNEVDTLQLPTQLSGNTSAYNFASVPWGYEILHLQGTGPMYSLPLAYMAEAWQAVAAREIGYPGGPQTLAAGDQIKYPTKTYCKRANMAVSLAGINASTKFVLPTIPLYGYWAPVYGEWFGQLMPINGGNVRMVPPWNGCNGVYVFLKGGCSGSITMTEADNMVDGISTPNGPIRLSAGVVDGVVWAL